MERRLPAFILDRQGALAALCQRTQARRLAVFGSAVRDDFEPSRSDVDFLVAFEDLPPIAYSNAYFELKQGLEDLFARPVDLLTPAMRTRTFVPALRLNSSRFMGAEAAKYLWDALQAGERAQRFALGMDYDAYCADEVRRSAIERQLEILGKALLRLRKVNPEAAARIPELHRAVALRHVLIHGYANVDNNIVWGVVRQHL